MPDIRGAEETLKFATAAETEVRRVNSARLFLFLAVLALPVMEVQAYADVYINTTLYHDGSLYREFDQHEKVTREAVQHPEQWDYVLLSLA